MENEQKPQADVTYIGLSDKPFHRRETLGTGLVILALAEDGTVIGIEVHAETDNSHEITYRIEYYPAKSGE